jgi:hypothetical protein
MSRTDTLELLDSEVRFAEFRLEMGWSAGVADKWLERDMPVARKPRFRGDDHIIDRKAVMRWLSEELEKVHAVAKPGDPDAAAKLSFEVERTRLTKEQADKTAFENEQSRKRLVDRHAVEAGLAVMDLALKDRLLTGPTPGRAACSGARASRPAPPGRSSGAGPRRGRPRSRTAVRLRA